MKKAKNQQVSESMALGVVLTLAGGFQDAYSYNCRDHVFANAQTGNIVLFGQNLAMADFAHAFRYLVPLLAFVGGVYVSEWVKYRYKEAQKIHWRQIVLAAEIVLLVLVGFLPQSVNIAANAVLSFACAMQVDSFRKFQGIPCATTMCIGNMRSATEFLCRYRQTKDEEMKKKSLYYYFIILVFAIGVAIGALLTKQIGERTIWITAGLLAAGFIMMFGKEEKFTEQSYLSDRIK